MPLRRQLSLRPVNSIKHVVDVASSVVTTIQTVVPLAEATDTPTIGAPASIQQGATVNAIYLRVECFATSTYTGVPRVYMAVFKNPGNNLIVPNPSNIGIDDNRKHVLHQEMTMVGNGALGSFPRTMFQGVIRIPPRLKRFGLNDKLVVTFQHAAGETSGITNVCVQCIYKEFK